MLLAGFYPFVFYNFFPKEGARAATGIACLFFLFIGSLGPFIDRQSQKLFWVWSVLMASSIAWPVLIYISFSSWDIVTRASIAIGLMIPFAVACDFLFIVLTRVILAQAAQSNSFLKIATLAIGNAFLACVLVVVPIAGGRWLKGFHLYYARELVFLGLSNVLDALVSLTWFLIAIMMLLHRLFWPLIERPVYALFRHRVFSEQKKLVFFSGVALLGLAVPSVGRILETLVKAVHS